MAPGSGSRINNKSEARGPSEMASDQPLKTEPEPEPGIYIPT